MHLFMKLELSVCLILSNIKPLLNQLYCFPGIGKITLLHIIIIQGVQIDDRQTDR